ncbi:coenzyme F420-reducing hydrogenase delta subunit [Thermodesulfitimonas autotrophica]|uniref:Coenzyme F420-reducing hydrogenase delta subunit n=2 Tax=Thermodesulfitimonas autotrophica TaxID=1894989 RepID=A0A3N5AAK6_9THEO|nr:coenzyme F420-reducing hydrogenase delta subunit [Thermodesulfitimonas autotrophica]
MANGFEPNIIAFLCNWCSYAGADLAGSLRYSYPPNIRIIRVPCSGRVEPEFILKAFFCGADGVLVGGCHPGDCHYVRGNYYAERRIKVLYRLLDWIGIERDRLRLEWVSASEGARFAQVASDFTARLKDLGPNSLKATGINYQSLGRVVAALGSAGKLLLEESVCMVEMVKYFLDFVQKESCGACVPCRVGTKRGQELLERVLKGEATGEDIALLSEVAKAVAPAARCDLGRMAGKALVYALECCQNEFAAHLAGSCSGTVAPNLGWQAIVG